jgi:hypothetical protein
MEVLWKHGMKLRLILSTEDWVKHLSGGHKRHDTPDLDAN